MSLAHTGKALAVLVALTTACSPSSSDTTGQAGVQRSIDSMSTAIERGDIDAIMRGFSEDFVLRRADGIVRGREAMRLIWEENFRGWLYEDSRITIERFSGSGDLAVTSGTMGGLLRPKDRPAAVPPDTFALPYLAEWALSDGKWVFRDLAVVYPTAVR
jgi:ketosteroid isomerase-like protein